MKTSASSPSTTTSRPTSRPAQSVTPLLLGLDHQRSDSDARWLWGSAGVPTINFNRPVYGQDFSKVHYFTMYDYNQKTQQTGLYVQDQMALDNWRLTLGGREDWVPYRHDLP